MKLLFWAAALLVASLHNSSAQEDAFGQGLRNSRQTSADQMVQNILQWLQGVYTENSRRIRQGSLREYLPPSNTQKPRPFEPVSPITQSPFGGGYPPAGNTPQPPFPIHTNPTTGGITGEGYPSPNNEIFPPHNNGYPSSPQPQPPFNANPSTGYPITGPGSGPSTGYPTQPPSYSTGYPSTQPPSYPTQGPSTQPPSERPGFPTGPPVGFPSTQPPSYPTQGPTGYPSTQPPSDRPGFPTGPPVGFPSESPSTQPPYQPSYTTGLPADTTTNPITSAPISTQYPITSAPGSSTHYTSPAATTESPSSTEEPTIKPDSSDNEGVTSGTPSVEDLKHPPHIHGIDVECAKDMMAITIEFNREFNGVIYSKEHYSTPECRYVNENSEQTKYKFTVSLNSCGTQFINAFDTQGQSYLENILVIQNELGIQEVWDTVRSVRCLWEGNLKDSLSVALSVGMLNQEIVTFSGDTATAKLDIQQGKGPFAPSASGLVKIGELMTLVISVTGDPGFDIQVKDCRATDSVGDRVYPLTDDNGCVLKPKLFGAFQKTKETRDTGASIIAYAFFNAFKFPDLMDLMIQCNIELCKTNCQMCAEPNQKVDPGRRKRDLYSYNNTEGVTMGKQLRVIWPEEINERREALEDLRDGVCMSTPSFVLSCAVMVSLFMASCLICTILYLKNNRLSSKL